MKIPKIKDLILIDIIDNVFERCQIDRCVKNRRHNYWPGPGTPFWAADVKKED